MKLAPKMAGTAFALLSLPLLAQQSGTATPPEPAVPPAPTQAATQSATPAQPPAQTTAPAPSPADMREVKGELVDKFDSKNAKTGDSVVVKVTSSVKTSDGTEIPKGSKLLGHVTAVQPHGQANPNSQVVLDFDQAQLKGGQTMPIRSEIQSLSPPGDANPATASSMPMESAPAAPSAGAGAPGSSGSTSGGAQAQMPSQPTPSMSSPGPPAATTNGPAPGTVVARTGNIEIRTTAIPGVLLAANEPGMQDPRLARASGILLGAQRDIHLDGGTRVVMKVADLGPGSGK